MKVITDNDKKVHTINLENVIYLPSACKNLISISKWSDDKKDNCAIMSRANHSIFLWDHDSKSKLIEHPPTCKMHFQLQEVSTHTQIICFSRLKLHYSKRKQIGFMYAKHKISSMYQRTCSCGIM